MCSSGVLEGCRENPPFYLTDLRDAGHKPKYVFVPTVPHAYYQ